MAEKGASITTQDLINLGNAEDYLRVASNICTLLEVVVATQKGLDISQVFSFSSAVMPIVSVLFNATSDVHFYAGVNGTLPFTAEQVQLLKNLGCNLCQYQESAQGKSHGADIVLSAEDFTAGVDGVVQDHFLFIHNTTKIAPADVLRIRKRMSTPSTTPMAIARMQRIAGVPVTYDQHVATDASAAALYAHLQELSGVEVNPNNYPVCYTTGLSAIASLWFTLVGEGGADIVMGSTAYGGSSELTDVVNSRAHAFAKYTFDITGTNPISPAIQKALDNLADNVEKKHPTTVLMVEIPTNPDMKVPKMEELAAILDNYQKKTQKKVLLLVDTTFAPGSKVFHKIQSVAPHLTTMVFISLSKSVSRGRTTAGTLVAGPSPEACDLLEKCRASARMMDTTSRGDQLYILTENHVGVAERCEQAYNNARTVGDSLQASVKKHCNGYDMPLAFVTPEQAAAGFYTSTYSFNLPPVPNAAPGVNEGLAQRFVDQLRADAKIKPCVSFGQDNGIVYATVPATSTQGAIKLEDKAKQAVGGVQLVRLSFPPTCDVAHLSALFDSAVKALY